MPLQNKLIGRIIEECTNVINETMINNKDNKDNDNTTYIFIGLFSIVTFILIVCSCIFIYFKWFKNKKKLLTTLLKMVSKSLKIKSQSYYYWYDVIFIDDFNIKFFKIAKRESRAGIDIYYIGYL